MGARHGAAGVAKQERPRGHLRGEMPPRLARMAGARRGAWQGKRAKRKEKGETGERRGRAAWVDQGWWSELEELRLLGLRRVKETDNDPRVRVTVNGPDVEMQVSPQNAIDQCSKRCFPVVATVPAATV